VHQATVVALLTGGGEERDGKEADPDLQHHNARARELTGMVAFGRLHPCGDGKHRCLLEAGLRYPRRILRVGRGQRTTGTARLAALLRQIGHCEKDPDTFEPRIQDKLHPYTTQQASLQEIPGLDTTVAAGDHRGNGRGHERVRKSVSQLASWTGLWKNQSAGKRKSSRIPKGNVSASNLSTCSIPTPDGSALNRLTSS